LNGFVFIDFLLKQKMGVLELYKEKTMYIYCIYINTYLERYIDNTQKNNTSTDNTKIFSIEKMLKCKKNEYNN